MYCTQCGASVPVDSSSLFLGLNHFQCEREDLPHAITSGRQRVQGEGGMKNSCLEA